MLTSLAYAYKNNTHKSIHHVAGLPRGVSVRTELGLGPLRRTIEPGAFAPPPLPLPR